MEIYYSIIIPHKNIPSLLQRCLDTIPIRDDIQVIVVDDNSDSDLVDFKNFPQWKGLNYITIFSKKTLYAGGARNEGLKCAIGKWLFFLDADDLLTKQANGIFDKYKNSLTDSIIFGIEIRDCYTLQLMSSENWYMQTLQSCLDAQNAMLALTTSCAKFIRREIVENNRISFSLDKHHNDTVFFTKAALSSNVVESCPDEILYIWTYREGSVSHTFNLEEIRCHFYTDLEKFTLVKKAGLNNAIGNYQLEHLQSIKQLTLIQQLPILFQMLISGMLFNVSKEQPLKKKQIIKIIGRTIKSGIKNQLGI